MKRLDEKTIDQIAQRNHFQAIIIEHVYWMKEILRNLQGTVIGKDFALMGGSAIAFLYGNIYRLSVDLDLDYIGDPNLGRGGTHEIEDKQTEHIHSIEDNLKALGLVPKMLKKDPDGRFLQYQAITTSVYGPQLSIDLDLGYRYCHSILIPKKVIFQDFIEGNNFEVQTLAQEEIWASKIIATIGGERLDTPDGKSYLGHKRKIRHLYDCFYLANEINNGNPKKIDLDLLRNIVILMGLTRIKDFEFFRGELVSLYSDVEIETELHPVLKTTQGTPSVIQLKRVVSRFLDSCIFHNYDHNIYDFFEEYSSYIFRPERLFPKDIADRIKGMYYYDEILKKVIPRK